MLGSEFGDGRGECFRDGDRSPVCVRFRDSDRDTHGPGRRTFDRPAPRHQVTRRPAALRLRPSGTAGAQACSSSGLRVSLGSASGAAGSVYRYIEFKNVASVPCTLYGFPGVSLLGGSPPRQIGAAATRVPNSRPVLVTLVPGGRRAR